MVYLRNSLLAGILALSGAASAGSLITTNLPSGTTIVNISGTNDGAANYDADQSNWYQPFAQNDNLLQLTLGPGTYSFGIVDPTDAQARFPLLTSTQLATIGGAWTYNSPWATDYLVFDASARFDSTQAQILSGAILPRTSLPGYGNAAAAYSAAKSGGYANQVVLSPGGRYHGTVGTSLTLASARTLIFAVPDNILTDNGGTVSVVVTAQAQPTPEPATLAAMALGGLAFVRRRTRRQGTVTTRS